MNGKIFLERIKKDALYLIVMLLAMFVIIWTYSAAEDYKNECNAFWEEQLDKCICQGDYNTFDDDMSITLPIEHAFGGTEDESKSIN